MMKTNLKGSGFDGANDTVVCSTNINGKEVRAVLTSEGQVMVVVSDVCRLIWEGGSRSFSRRTILRGLPEGSRIDYMLSNKALHANACVEASVLYDAILKYRKVDKTRRRHLAHRTIEAIDSLLPKFRTAFIDGKEAEPVTPVEPVAEPAPEPVAQPEQADPLDSLAQAIAGPLAKAIKAIIANQKATFEAQAAKIAKQEAQIMSQAARIETLGDVILRQNNILTKHDSIFVELRDKALELMKRVEVGNDKPPVVKSMQKQCNDAAHRYAGVAGVSIPEAWNIIHRQFKITHGKDLQRMARERGSKAAGLGVAAEIGMLDEMYDVIYGLTKLAA
jgi:hypothetical protein